MTRTLLLTAIVSCTLWAQRTGHEAKNKLSIDLHETAEAALQARGSDEPIDVIVQFADEASDKTLHRWNALWGELMSESENLPFKVLRIRPSRLEKLAADPNVVFISPDRVLGATHFPP